LSLRAHETGERRFGGGRDVVKMLFIGAGERCRKSLAAVAAAEKSEKKRGNQKKESPSRKGSPASLYEPWGESEDGTP